MSGAALDAVCDRLAERLSHALRDVLRQAAVEYGAAIMAGDPQRAGGDGGLPRLADALDAQAAPTRDTPPVSPAPPASSDVRRQLVWSDRRVALLRELWAAGKDNEAILFSLNHRAAGLPIASGAAVQTKAYALGLGPRGTPTPPAAASVVAPLAIWTAERDAVIVRDIPDDQPLDDIFSRLCALPGAPIKSADLVNMRANQLGVRRPRPMVAPDATRCVTATFADIIDWGRANGVLIPTVATEASVVEMVNRARADHNLPRFKRVVVAGA